MLLPQRGVETTQAFSALTSTYNLTSARRPQLGDCVEKVGVGSGQARVLKQLGARGALGGCHLRRHRDQLGHLAEVLGSSGEEELVFGAVWASQAQSIQLQDAFEVSK